MDAKSRDLLQMTKLLTQFEKPGEGSLPAPPVPVEHAPSAARTDAFKPLAIWAAILAAAIVLYYWVSGR